MAWEWSTNVSLAVEIADGLDAAHSEETVHRELTPPTSSLTLRGHAMILDFGSKDRKRRNIAKSGCVREHHDGGDRPHLTTPGFTLGTIAHLSPEQARVPIPATPN